MIKIETGISIVKGGYQTWFKIGNQIFYLEPHEKDILENSKHSALFFKNMLDKAFKKLESD